MASLRYLLQASHDGTLRYGKVVLAGHSLGSQIAFDAINRINLLINNRMIWGYDGSGRHLENGSEAHVSEILCGLMTFGSPLDKIAFFLREHVPDDAYIRLQLLNNYHGFKQRNWDGPANIRYKIPSPFSREFDGIRWCNYYDKYDYVSGGLDYYGPLTNINCGFRGNIFSFTHSSYWKSRAVFADFLNRMVLD